MTKNALITGAHGFLGKHVAILLTKSYNVFTPKRDYCDFSNRDDVLRLFDSIGQIDVLIHLAADVGGIGYNQKTPYDLFYKNAIMGIELIDISIGRVRKFVQIGTACSYPKYCPTPFDPADLWDGYPEETNAAYGIAKRLLLTQIQAARQQYGFNGIYVIPTNLYGPGNNFSRNKSHVIPSLIKKFIDAKRNNETSVKVWGNGSATRDFLYVVDAAWGICTAVETYNDGEPLNLGSGRSISISQLVNMIKEESHFTGLVKWDYTKLNGQPWRQLDSSVANNTLDWYPEVSLKEGLKSTVEWYEKQ